MCIPTIGHTEFFKQIARTDNKSIDEIRLIISAPETNSIHSLNSPIEW